MEEGTIAQSPAGRNRVHSRNWQRPELPEPTGRWRPRPCRTFEASGGWGRGLVCVLRALGSHCRAHCWSRHGWVESHWGTKLGDEEGAVSVVQAMGVLVYRLPVLMQECAELKYAGSQIDRLEEESACCQRYRAVSVSDLCGMLNGGALCLSRDTGRGLWLALWGAGRREERISF